MDDTRQVPGKAANCSWAKYADQHRLIRISEFPRGVSAPEKVRLYARRHHYVLQWWEKKEKRTLNERVEGDLVIAIIRAREIENRLQHFNASGRKSERCCHATIVDRFLKALQLRADAREIDVATTQRYESALRRHYLPFIEQPDISKRYREASAVDGQFQQLFAAFLSHVQVSPNGHPNARTRPLKQTTFIMDAVRAMFEWAADPERGSLLPEGFRNPFARRKRETRQVAADPLTEPDISVSMAVNLLSACDPFQLAIFAPLALYGLRPGELGWMFREYIREDWVRVPCNLDLDYLTKGRRQKTFPVVGCLRTLWNLSGQVRNGLLYIHRQVDVKKFSAAVARKLFDEQIVAEFVAGRIDCSGDRAKGSGGVCRCASAGGEAWASQIGGCWGSGDTRSLPPDVAERDPAAHGGCGDRAANCGAEN